MFHPCLTIISVSWKQTNKETRTKKLNSLITFGYIMHRQLYGSLYNLIEENCVKLLKIQKNMIFNLNYSNFSLFLSNKRQKWQMFRWKLINPTNKEDISVSRLACFTRSAINFHKLFRFFLINLNFFQIYKSIFASFVGF